MREERGNRAERRGEANGGERGKLVDVMLLNT